RENQDAAIYCQECGTNLGLTPSQIAVTTELEGSARRHVARWGTVLLTVSCLAMSSVFFVQDTSPLAKLGFLLVIASPVLLGFGVWIAYVCATADVRQLEREVLAFLLFCTLSCLLLASLFVGLIFITGFGPP